MFREMITNPDAMRMVSDMARSGMGGNPLGSGMFGMGGGAGGGLGARPGATTATPGTTGAQAGGARAPINLFNPPPPTGQGQGGGLGGVGGGQDQAAQLQQLQQLMANFGGADAGGNLFGSPFSPPQQPADARPAEERFAVRRVLLSST
jgi:hypothetical protein